MKKEEYLKIIKEKLDNKSVNILSSQIENYYKSKEYLLPKNEYKIGDKVFLKKGTLLHGTYKNIEGLKEILKDGLISSWFIDGRVSKYPSSVGVWNLQKDYYLKDYINFYSGCTIRYFNQMDSKREIEVISFNEMPNLMNRIISMDYLAWQAEQTKEARFMPSLVQNKVQIGIIFNGDNDYTKMLLNGDILDDNNINDSDVRNFVNEKYYDQFIIDRKNKDAFFTDRESAILFGIPANLIEGILVGRDYENNEEVLNEIKKLLPYSYICNLDGVVLK